VVDSLAREIVQPHLRGRFGREYLYLEQTPSTQRLLDRETAEGTVAVAEEQTEGRGRLGRQWLAPARSSVHCSVKLVPPVEPTRLPELTLVAGEACAAAITGATGLETAIKLPNDVLVEGRKVAGILAEANEGHVVLGIGINVNQAADELPTETQVPATSLRMETGAHVDRVELLVRLLAELETRYDAWVAG
jgi:BirA family transcriptional regulator, biotin operon repressor / biotin---[acetyl-CoA-carboxylase] ligase